MKVIHLLSAAALLVFSPGAAFADTIKFLGEPTQVNDGSFYVLPYQVTINGVNQLVACYDIFDDVHVGDTYQANILTLNQTSLTGYFATTTSSLAKYERVAWLDAQQYQSPAQQIGLQYAIWDVFGTYRTTPESLSYDMAADSAAATGYQGFDFTRVRFIEEPGVKPGQAGAKQAFVYWAPAPGTGLATATPEPASTIMALSGLAFIVGCGLRANRRRALRRQS